MILITANQMSGEALTTLDDHFLLGELRIIIIISQVIQCKCIIFSNKISVLFLVDLIALLELKIQRFAYVIFIFLCLVCVTATYQTWFCKACQITILKTVYQLT